MSGRGKHRAHRAVQPATQVEADGSEVGGYEPIVLSGDPPVGLGERHLHELDRGREKRPSRIHVTLHRTFGVRQRILDAEP